MKGPSRLRASSLPALSTFNSANTALAVYVTVFLVCLLGGYGIGYLTTDLVVSGARGAITLSTSIHSDQSASLHHKPRKYRKITEKKRFKGDTIHSVLTSSGDAYQNFQTRIMYGTYKLVQKQPGGERLTGFTRILHRTVPDVLMEEVPTFHAKPLKPACDQWCEYPVANRPDAIWQFFKAASKNESMIQGAWVFMLECDYVWMQPMQVPGDAYDGNVPGVQFLYDYIIPDHPNAIDSMRKLYNGPVEDIPASGPSPVLLRFSDWMTIVPDYVRLSAIMESDPVMKQKLGWVREMYAWDAACAHHLDIPILTELHTNSSTIVQPPFDEAPLNRAALCHYTWGALYHVGLPSKGGKQIYRWEKRDFNDMKFVLRVPKIPMPPPYQDGWTLEFDAPLTRPRHDLVVLMLTQMNKAIETLPDLTEHWKEFQPKLKEYERLRDEQAARDAALAATAAVMRSQQTSSLST